MSQGLGAHRGLANRYDAIMACREVAVSPPAGAIHTMATATARRRAASDDREGGRGHRRAGDWLAGVRENSAPTPKKKRAPRARKYLRRPKLSADCAGLARRGHRLAGLDYGGFVPCVGRAEVGHARGKANAGDQRRADQRQCHHLQVGYAVGGKQREIVHDTLPKTSQPLVAANRRKVHGLAAGSQLAMPGQR
jgi:hypothetical protein